MNLTPTQFVLLENAYFKNFPIYNPDEIFIDYNTILKYKNLLKIAKPDKRILILLLDTVINKINNKKRFQKITFIKLIRRHCCNTVIDNEISDKLFFVFKSLIKEVNEKIAWSLSVTIKDIELSQENIEWLIENYENSRHVQNRLLRYPKPNIAITNWCEQRLKKKDLNDRLSELIGLKLNFDINFTFQDKISLIWGVHYSKLPDKTKKELLLKYMTTDNFWELIKICEKNNFIDIIFELYNDFVK